MKESVSKKIKILGVVHPYRGGLAAYKERLAVELIACGHQVTIETFTMLYPGFLFPGKTQYSSSPAPSKLGIQRTINSVNPLNWIRLGNRIKREAPDLLIIKFWIPFIGPSLGTIARIIRKNAHTKVICILDNVIPHEKRIGDFQLTNYLIKSVDGFISMSEQVMGDLGQFDSSRPRLLSPHPIFDNFGPSVSRSTALERLSLDDSYRYILFFGFIRDYKGLDLLIEAFADLRVQEKNLKLIIAGEYYADEEKYRQLIQDSGVSDNIVQYNEFIADEKVVNYFCAADFVVQPYKSATQSGITQIAYHFETPMIVTEVGGLKETCPDDKVGYVVKAEAGSIADAIVKMSDEPTLKRLKAGVVEEKKRFGWDRLVNNIFEVYSKLE